jgi:hypothetical protein
LHRAVDWDLPRAGVPPIESDPLDDQESRMSTLVRVRAVKPLEGFVVRIDFTDGTQRDVDLEPYLHGPIFAPIRDDIQVFRAVQVDPQAGTIVWSNGADIDPDVLYRGLKPAWMDAERQPLR